MYRLLEHGPCRSVGDVLHFALGLGGGAALHANGIKLMVYVTADPVINDTLHRGRSWEPPATAVWTFLRRTMPTATSYRSTTCNGTAARQWTYDSASGTLQALGKCLDSGAGTTNGTLLVVKTCSGATSPEVGADLTPHSRG